jgi:hypothetical protein
MTFEAILEESNPVGQPPRCCGIAKDNPHILLMRAVPTAAAELILADEAMPFVGSQCDEEWQYEGCLGYGPYERHEIPALKASRDSVYCKRRFEV